MTYSNNLPVHGEQTISYPYGVVDPTYSCGWHTGVDIVPYGSTENLPLLYSVVIGTVVAINNDPNNRLGCYVIIYDGTYYWRYCHLTENSIQVTVNQNVTKNTIIGRMGATGNVTGRHLHLECSTTVAWQCDTFVNPCWVLGFPNVQYEILVWQASPVPPATIRRKKFKWVLYARKLRDKR